MTISRLLLTVAAGLLLAPTACAHSQFERGNGTLMEVRTPLPVYRAIRIEAPVDVEISEGGFDAAEISIDSNLVNRLRLDVEGEELVVSFAEDVGRIHPRSSLKLRLPALERLTHSGSGNVVVQPRRQRVETLSLKSNGSGDLHWKGGDCESLHVKLSGSGDLRFQGRARKAEVDSSGSGALRADLGGVDALELQSRGSGKIELAGGAQAIRLAIRGSGPVVLDGGSTSRLEATLEGTGDLEARRLSARELDVVNSGTGHARVKASGGKVALTTSGTGNIAWWGSASSVDGNQGGLGRITHRDAP